MSKEYEMETMREIWPLKGDGARWEIGPDRDGLGCVEIRYRESGSEKIVERMMFDPAATLLIAEALKLCAQELQASDA